MKSFYLFLLVLAFAIALDVFVLREAHADAPPSCPRLTLSGSLSGGAGVPGLGYRVGEAPTSAFVEGRLALAGLPLGVTATLAVRHFLDDGAYWRDKRRVVAGLEMSVGRDASLFGEWERRYSVGEDYTIAGFRLKFGGSR